MSEQVQDLESLDQQEVKLIKQQIVSAVNEIVIDEKDVPIYKRLRLEPKRSSDTSVNIYSRIFPKDFSEKFQHTYVEEALANLIIINDKRVKILDEYQRRDDIVIDNLEEIFRINQMLNFRIGILTNMYYHHTRVNFFASIMKPDNTNAINNNTRDVRGMSSAELEREVTRSDQLVVSFT